MDMVPQSHIFATGGSIPPSLSNPSPHLALVLTPHITALAHFPQVTYTAFDGAGSQRSAHGALGVPRIGRASHTVIISPLTDLTAVTRQANNTFVTTGNNINSSPESTLSSSHSQFSHSCTGQDPEHIFHKSGSSPIIHMEAQECAPLARRDHDRFVDWERLLSAQIDVDRELARLDRLDRLTFDGECARQFQLGVDEECVRLARLDGSDAAWERALSARHDVDRERARIAQLDLNRESLYLAQLDVNRECVRPAQLDLDREFARFAQLERDLECARLARLDADRCPIPRTL